MQEDDSQEEAYVRIKVLGKGAFGEAVLYQKPENNFLVVWKEIDLNRVSSRSYVEVQNEIEILSLLNHPNIVAYYNHYFHEQMLYIEMEYVNGGTLYHKLANQTSLFPEETVLWYFYQILSAMAYLHEKSILHRDIKTLNIFMSKSALIKLGDFGMSKIMEKNVMADTVVGTPYYMSPELIKGQKYDAKSDIWAIGCVLHEILTLKKTFEASNTLKLANDIIKGEIAPIDSSYSPEISDMVKSCFKLDPMERPTARDMLQENFLKDREKYINSSDGEFSVKLETSSNFLDSRPVSRSGVFNVKDPNESSSIIPVVTQSSTEVFFWGGGKTQPQMLDIFTEGKSALSAALGDHHIAVVTIEKELFTWLLTTGGGFENLGQLGHNDTAFYKAPKIVTAFEGIRLCNVACGSDFTCCLTDTGVLYTFGSNYFGCLAAGQAVDCCLEPYKVETFNSEPIKALACGENHVVVATKAENVYSWGCGEFGRLGNDSEDDEFLPVKLAVPKIQIVQIACGADFTVLLTDSGKLLACGSNEQNKIGLNQVLKGVAPEAISFDTPCVKQLTLVKPLTKFRIVHVACGKSHSAVVNDAGHLLTFGSNEFGQLGQGDTKPRTKVVEVKNALAGKKVTKVSCGDGFTIAVTIDNQVYSWGLGENGRLGMDLSMQCKGVAFTSLPRSIFGTLYKVKHVCSRGWNTLLIAEKVFSQRTLRPASATGSRPGTAASPEKSNAQNASPKRIDKNPGEDSIHVISLEESETMVTVRALDESSAVPTWLAEELEGNEMIPMVKPSIPAAENEGTDENEILPANQLQNLQNEIIQLTLLIEQKNKKIKDLESQVQSCSCNIRKRLESEEVFDV